MNISRLDDLPVELFHNIFHHLSAYEIFYAFTNVTPYIDSLLNTYGYYRLKFKTIRRNHFDLVCQRIIPDQVIALTLSDDNDTPGLIDLFLSRFQLDQFTRLQALKLMEIRLDCSENIISQMTPLKHLRSFIYYPVNRADPCIPKMTADRIVQLDRSLFDMYSPILPQLCQLRLDRGDLFSSIQFPRLRYLTLGRSSYDVLKHISSAASQLHTLQTRLSIKPLPAELFPPMPDLTRLILETRGKYSCD